MRCKCGATTYKGHLKAKYPAHVYKGFYWAPKDGEVNG